MIAYNGKEPYIFASYSHKDIDIVLPLISALKQKMCRVWFDEGLVPGESWNDDIANHLLNCTEFVVFISPDSVKSQYVFSEINFAIAKKKKILPIVIKETKIPIGLEMMLSTIQFVEVCKMTEISQITNTICSLLGKEVFSLKNMPFLQDFGYSFYLINQDVEREEINLKNASAIYCEDSSGKKQELFALKRLSAYDVSFKISSVEPIKDYFYPGKITGSYQINIKGSFLLEYPLYGPDVEVLLIFILRIKNNAEPTLKLIDYHYVDSVSSLSLLDEEDLNVVGTKGWSAQIKDYLEEKLFK